MPLDTALEETSPFTDILATWNRPRRGTDLPLWSDFDFIDFKGWHSRIKVSVFPDDGPDPKFRIMGESWRIVTLGNVAGFRFSEIRPRLYHHQLREHFAALREQRMIGLTSGSIAGVARDFMSIDVLELPYTLDRQTVGGLIHCLHIQRQDLTGDT
ncbi:MAG: hypothetical protein P1U88_05340 [Thalassobaculaceae bacterium]|nr:hypothetical protein [Thalassobaculaceae bacterium]